jgi:soluble lytic murein transglycosylase-like protein
LVMAFIAVESGFNVQATSVKNAQGLMQLIPETAQRFGVKDAYKAEDNIKGGLAYLRWLLAYYEGNVELVAAAYNAGEGAVDKYKGVPPYAETRIYVKKIAKLYNNATHPYQDNLVKKSAVQNFPNKKTM